MGINDGRPFLIRDAPAFGFTDNDVRRALRTGTLHRPFRGVAVDGTAEDTRELRLAALSLVIPDGAAASDHTAAWVYGADTHPPGQRHDLRPMCVVRHGFGRPTPDRALTRQTVLPDPDVVELDGVAVTSPLRTASDLLRLSWRPYALAAVDTMARAGVVDPAEVAEFVARLRRFPGTKQAQELAPHVDGRRESPGESWMGCRMLDAGLPRPAIAHHVVHRGRDYWLDSAFVARKVAAEYDGREFHSDPDDVRHDGDRRGRMSHDLGWAFVIGMRERIFGTDDAFEQELGALMNVQVRPRIW